MKNSLLSISLLLITTLTYSQNSKIKYGIQAGLNYSNFRGYEYPDQFKHLFSESPAFAYLGGLNLEYQIKEKLSLKLELNYERKSQKSDEVVEFTDANGYTKDYDFISKKNHDYLVLPIMLKYNFSNKNSFYVNAGPFIGFLLKSNLTNDLEKINNLKYNPVSTTHLHNKTDFGISIGLGKTFSINKKNAIFIEFRENLGLTNTSNFKVWGNGELKTNSLNFVIGYLLN